MDPLDLQFNFAGGDLTTMNAGFVALFEYNLYRDHRNIMIIAENDGYGINRSGFHCVTDTDTQ